MAQQYPGAPQAYPQYAPPHPQSSVVVVSAPAPTAASPVSYNYQNTPSIIILALDCGTTSEGREAITYSALYYHSFLSYMDICMDNPLLHLWMLSAE